MFGEDYVNIGLMITGVGVLLGLILMLFMERKRK
jgi:hypothetical protein